MRSLPALILAAVTALILVVTLLPAPGQHGYLTITCIFCGEHATSDAIANVILFFPLGFALAWWRPGSRAWRLGPALSLAIELTQRFISGRDASIGDVITNTTGTLLGWIAWRYIVAGAARPAPRQWPWAAAAVAAVVAVTVWMMQPAATGAPYYGMWTPVLGHFEWYRGRVLSATVDREPLPAVRLPDPEPVDEFVDGRRTLHVRFVAGTRTTALAPLVAVYDSAQQGIMVLGMDREAFVLRYRRHAADWKLDAADSRFENVVPEWATGDTIAVSVSRTARTTCVTLRDSTRCVRGVTPGLAWSLVMYPESLPPNIRDTLTLLWPAGLMLLLGWCAGTRNAALAGGAASLAALVLLPPLVGGAPTPPAEIGAAIVGLPLGVVLRRWAAGLGQSATSRATTATQRSMRS